MPIELLPILMPAMVIVAVAIRIVRHSAPPVPRVIDLRDPDPAVVRSAPPSGRTPVSGPPTGALIEPTLGGTLGARMRSVADAPDARSPVEPAADAGEPPPARGKVVIARRRRRPLVAQR